ncbi:MAG: DNA/RNA non-specific endonuclease [Bacteroidota bacterium]
MRSSKGGSSSSKTTLIRSVFFFIGICVMIYILSNVKADSWEFDSVETTTNNVQLSDQRGENIEISFHPESTTGEVINHKHYTLSYHEEHEQAEWVAYKLTKDNLRKPRVKRAKKFSQDKSVSTLSAKHNDYSHSGYTRGHLAPAGDMAFSQEAMRESFYMSNMSPQLKEFNGGIWRELEETVRNWADDNDELYIVTGPIIKDNVEYKKIGYNEVSVPHQFFKIILDLKLPEQKAIAFLMPNEKSEKRISEYIVSIDELEALTGINFFAGFLPLELEEELEKKGNLKQWKFEEAKYRKRIEKWNNY